MMTRQVDRNVIGKNTQFPESNCGSNYTGSQKILVAYASKYGTTAEVAEAIGKVLCKEGKTVEIK